MSVLIIGGIFREILDGDTQPRPRMGGSGLTAAIIAARLGSATQLAGYVGAEDADAVFAMLDTVSVDRSLVAVLPGASGTFVFPTAADDRHPWPLYRPAEAVPDRTSLAVRADVALVFGMPDFDAIAAGWLDLNRDDVLLWDRQGFLSRPRDSRAAAALAPTRKLYLANLDEMHEEFPADPAQESLAVLPPIGFTAAVIKRGANGCSVIDMHGIYDVAGFPLEIVATIGSGDAFAGALAAGLDAGQALVDATRRANAVASAFLERGDALAEGLLERIEELLQSRAA